MNAIEDIIRISAELGAVEALRMTGATSGEISQRQAVKTYGRWFIEAVRNNRIQPVNIGSGDNGKRAYLISDILRLKTAEAVKVELKSKSL